MRKILFALALLMSMPALAVNESIMFEIGIGFGESGGTTKTKEELANKFNNKFCYHRPSSRLVYGAVRYRYDDVEAHVGGWFNDADRERCERDSWVVGLGYVLDTQNINYDGADDLYATYTPGIAYTWGSNKDFNTQDNTNTNWRLKDNWQMYNRVAVGGGNEDYAGEIAVVRYGLIIKDDYERKGESFVTVSGGFRDWSDGNGQGAIGTVPVHPIEPPADEPTNITNNITTINITNNGQSAGNSSGTDTGTPNATGKRP